MYIDTDTWILCQGAFFIAMSAMSGIAWTRPLDIAGGAWKHGETWPFFFFGGGGRCL